MDPTSAAVQEDTCIVTQSIILLEAGWDHTKRLEMEKGYADVNRELLRVFNIYALHLTSNVCMHRVWQALGVHYH